MNVLFFIDDLGPGGSQRQLVNLALATKIRKHNVSILTYSKNEFYHPILILSDINIICLAIENPIRRIIEVRRFIRKNNFNVVISFLGVPSFIAELAGIPIRKWKLIVGERSSNPLILNSIKSRFMRLFHIFADHIISNSYANQDIVRKVNTFIPESKYEVIYNAIDLKRFYPLENFKFKSKSKVKIIVPASYRKLKNLIGLIEGINQLNELEKKLLVIDWYGDRTPNSNPDYILDVAEKLISKYHLENIVSLYDATPDIYLKIQKADAVGLFSFFEGLPNAICEGMACGKPIIASAVSDIPLIVTNNENGYLCNAEDTKSITSALRKIINASPELLAEMGEISYQRAIQLFDKDMITEKYLKVMGS